MPLVYELTCTCHPATHVLEVGFRQALQNYCLTSASPKNCKQGGLLGRWRISSLLISSSLPRTLTFALYSLSYEMTSTTDS